MIHEIGTRVITPNGPGMVEYITKRGMPNMGYTVKLDHEFKDEDGDKVDRVHYPHNYVDAA